jgi:MFS family permease
MNIQIKFKVLCIGCLICCLGLSLITPFYPTYAERFDISKTLLGLIFAINPIGGFIASLIMGKLLN